MTIPIRPRQPPLGGEPNYGTAIYPDPPSHDFLVWLIIADLSRRAHGALGPLRVKLGLIRSMLGTIDFGPFSLKDGRGYQCGVSRSYYLTMRDGVMRPAMAMIGAVEEPPVHLDLPMAEGALDGWVEYDYHMGHLVDAGRAGFTPPMWRPPEWAFKEVDEFLDGQRPVVITLRETTAQPERNSNLNAWIRVAGRLINRGYSVLFVRDTTNADEWFPHPTYPDASRNAFIRVALYQRARLNMMVCNGPVEWLKFSPVPYLIFKQLIPALPEWQHGQPEGWREQDHMDFGDQYPWATPLQRMTWLDDTFENIMDEFEKIEGDLE